MDRPTSDRLPRRASALKAEDALRVAEARLLRAQEAVGIGLFSVSIADGTLYPTPHFCRLYGMPERESYPAEAFENLVLAQDRHLASTAESRRSG